MTTGPTQNYADPGLATQRARPVLALAVRAAVAALPLVLALVVGAVAALALPPERLGLPVWLWLVGVVATTSGVLFVCSRLLRRLAPLSALLRISLVLPDDVPHRFALARRRWSPAALERSTATDDEAPSQRLLALVATLAAHDGRTRAHAERVQAYAALIGRELGLSDRDVGHLSWAALLHDVGKVHVAPEIINKAGRPSEEEWAQLQAHPHHGGELVEPLRGWLGDWLDGVEQHHERFDGTGYPRRLAGQDISLAARIIAVADTYDVITSARSYKKPMSAEQARAEIIRCAGAQFDPVVVRALLSVGIAELRRIAGPATLLAALPVVIAAPAQAAPSVGAVLQAAGGHAATAVLAAGVGVTGGVATADVLAAPPAARVLVVQGSSASAGTTTGTTGGTGDATGGTAQAPADRAAGPAPDGAAPVSGTPSAGSASAQGDVAVEPGATATPATGQTPQPAQSGPPAATPSSAGTAPRPPSSTAPSAVPTVAPPVAPAVAPSAVPTVTPSTPSSRGAAPAPAPGPSTGATAGADDAAEAAQKAAQDAAARATRDAAAAAKAAQDAAAKAAKDAADTAKKASDAAGKLTGGLTSGLTSGLTGGLTGGRTSTPSGSSAAPPAPSTSSSSSGGLVGGLLNGSR